MSVHVHYRVQCMLAIAQVLLLSYVRPLSLYCLVDEVLRRGKIMPDEEKKTWHFVFILFFPPTWPKNQRFFSRKLYKSSWYLLISTHKSNFLTFFSSDQRQNVNFYFFFFLLRQRTKDPCRSSSTKQYSECGLIAQIKCNSLILLLQLAVVSWRCY